MFLIIDQGTTSTKAMLFDLNGNKLDSCQKSFQQIFPNNGWVEHNPQEIIKTVIDCCNEIISNNLDKKILLVEWPNFLEKIIKDPIIFKINFGKTNYERDVIINLPKNFTMIEK